MKYFIVGDIHGRNDLLTDLLAKAEKSCPDAKLIFVGDSIDRGPDAFKVVETIKNLVETKGAIALHGNHEDMMLNYVRDKIVRRDHPWRIPCNGANKTVDSYGKATGLYGHGKFFGALISTGHYKFLKELPLYYETDEIWISHAPVPNLKVREYSGSKEDFRIDKEVLTWSYLEPEFEGTHVEDHKKLAIAGHIHAINRRIFEPRIYDKIIYVDTGAGCWDKAPLTGIIVNDGKYVGFLQSDPTLLKI